MQAIRAKGTIDEQGRLILDTPLSPKPVRRVEVIVLIEEVDENDAVVDDDSDEEILASLHRSLEDAKAGRIHPVSELWAGISNINE